MSRLFYDVVVRVATLELCLQFCHLRFDVVTPSIDVVTPSINVATLSINVVTLL